MNSGEGLDCISLTSCRIRFTAGLLRLYFAVAAIAAASGNLYTPPPPPTGAGWEAFELGIEEEREREVVEARGRY
jgi:hypothetical protein